MRRPGCCAEYNPAQDASPFALSQVADGGDIAVNPFNINEAVETVEAAADDLLGTGARLMTLGGDHTIALPLLRSVAKKHGPVALLHFDAHLDTWDTYFGAEYTHGTPFRRAVEEGILDTSALSHVGTRGPLYGKQDADNEETLEQDLAKHLASPGPSVVLLPAVLRMFAATHLDSAAAGPARPLPRSSHGRDGAGHPCTRSPAKGS
ncbi:Agmatinase [Streptomyces violarus]